jgi:hypothetical protein
MDWDALGVAKPSHLVVWRARANRLNLVCGIRGHRVRYKNVVSSFTPQFAAPQLDSSVSILMMCACRRHYKVVSGADPYVERKHKRRVSE